MNITIDSPTIQWLLTLSIYLWLILSFLRLNAKVYANKMLREQKEMMRESLDEAQKAQERAGSVITEIRDAVTNRGLSEEQVLQELANIRKSVSFHFQSNKA